MTKSYIDDGYKKIQRKYSDFFRSRNTRLEQYVIIGKKSEKFQPLELGVFINKELPEEIKTEVHKLYNPILHSRHQ